MLDDYNERTIVICVFQNIVHGNFVNLQFRSEWLGLELGNTVRIDNQMHFYLGVIPLDTSPIFENPRVKEVLRVHERIMNENSKEEVFRMEENWIKNCGGPDEE